MQISNIDLQRITYNILLVSPDRAYLEKIKNDLKEEFNQIQFLEATDSYEALNLLEAHNITTVISDSALPDVSGPELFESAQQSNRDQIPFIFLYNQQEKASLKEKVFSLGILEHVEKSYDHNDLAHKVRNLSHIKIMQDQLQRSSEFNRSLIDSSMDMIVAVDRNRQIIEFNKAAEKTFGYKKDEVLGRHVSFLYAERDASINIYEHTRQENNYSGEVLNCRKSGEVFPSHLSASVLYDRNGKVMGYMGISRDISKQKKMEKKLQQAREEAESANRMKSQFLASMSHELKMPLNTIMGYSQLFEMDEDLKKNQHAHIRTMKRSASHLSRLIDDVMDLARIEGDQLKLVVENFDINELTQDLERIIGLYINEKDIEFSIEKEEGLPNIVEGDGLRLRQVLMNLLSNAVKFTDHGAIKLKLKTGYSDSVNGSGEEERIPVNFQVEDSGHGITESEKEEIFKPFYQSRGGGRSGTGLGLAISSELVKLMGGELKFSSKKESGSRFYFTIPLRRTHRSQVEPYTNHIDSNVIIDDDREWTVLVMDESQDDRMMLKNFLETIGFSCYQVAGLNELKEQAQLLSPDIMILEPLLQGMDLSQVVEMMDEEPFSGKTTIITSLLDRHSIAESCQSNNLDAFLKKPLDFGMLLQVINDRTDVPLTRSNEASDTEMDPNQMYSLLVEEVHELEEEQQEEFWLGIEVMDVNSIVNICEQLNELPATLDKVYNAAVNMDYRLLLEIQELYMSHNRYD